MSEKPQDGIARPLDDFVIHSCYGCGKPAIKESKYWPSAWICEECNDWQIAGDYAWHCETGE